MRVAIRRTVWTIVALAVVGRLLAAEPGKTQSAGDAAGTLPVGASGKPLNLDFETGTLDDWAAAGEAFVRQPIKGDSPTAR